MASLGLAYIGSDCRSHLHRIDVQCDENSAIAEDIVVLDAVYSALLHEQPVAVAPSLQAYVTGSWSQPRSVCVAVDASMS